MLTSTFLKPTHKPFLRVPSHVLYVTLPVLGAFLQVYLRCCVQWLLFSTKAYKKLTRVKHKLSTMYRHVKKIKGWIFCLHKAIPTTNLYLFFGNVWLIIDLKTFGYWRIPWLAICVVEVAWDKENMNFKTSTCSIVYREIFILCYFRLSCLQTISSRLEFAHTKFWH